MLFKVNNKNWFSKVFICSCSSLFWGCRYASNSSRNNRSEMLESCGDFKRCTSDVANGEFWKPDIDIVLFVYLHITQIIHPNMDIGPSMMDNMATVLKMKSWNRYVALTSSRQLGSSGSVIQ